MKYDVNPPKLDVLLELLFEFVVCYFHTLLPLCRKYLYGRKCGFQEENF